MNHEQANVVIAGAGMGGIAAALAAADAGKSVIMTEETDRIGGQATSQGVPTDEHDWIESYPNSASYARFREGVREHYRRNYPLTEVARAAEFFNPGSALVSRVAHEPRVGQLVLEELISAHVAARRIRVLYGVRPIDASVTDDRIEWVEFERVDGGPRVRLAASMFIDATERGDLLPVVGAEHVVGAEAKSDTGELHAPDHAEPLDQQSMSWCFAVELDPDGDHTIDRPESYDRWAALEAPYVPGARQLSWAGVDVVTLERKDHPLFAGDTDEAWLLDQWHFRRILARRNFEPGSIPLDICLVNWAQIDYWSRPTVTPGGGLDYDDFAIAAAEAKELSQSWLYWLQTEAPRADGGLGYPGMRLRGDALNTEDGFAFAPYIRESRRIVALQRVTEADVGVKMIGRGKRATEFADAIGTGHYRIDLHPGATGRNFVDIDCYPFQIPLGALIPKRVGNLLAGAKNIGTTHITNGAYRLHPVEWSIGEAAGIAASTAIDERVAVQSLPEHVAAIQDALRARGVSLEWPESILASYRERRPGETQE